MASTFEETHDKLKKALEENTKAHKDASEVASKEGRERRR